MLWSVIRQTIALISLCYISMLMSLSTWVVLPTFIGWTPTIVMSGSMEPNIMTGDILIAQPVTDEQKRAIVPGQVLLAENPLRENTLVTHRVVNVLEGEGFITKGDANAKADPTMIPFENVQGLERLRIPMIGIPLQAVRAGNYSIPIAFVVVSLLSQAVLLKEWRIQKSPAKAQPQKVRPANKQLSNTMVITNVLILAATPFMVSSDALFTGKISNPSNVFKASTVFTPSQYSNIVLADSPSHYYRLNELRGVEAVNSAPNGADAIYSATGITYAANGALRNAPNNTAVKLDGISSEITNKKVTAGLQTLTLEMWFKTTSTSGGQILGFHPGVNSVAPDRVIYMSSSGKIFFGIDTKTKTTVSTSSSYNDGNWHLITVTLSRTEASLFMDGKLISSGSTTSAPTNASGSWVISGESKLAGWAEQPSSRFFGSLDEIAIYPKVLTPAQVLNHYNAG